MSRPTNFGKLAGIRQALDNGRKYPEIQKSFSVSPNTISKAKTKTVQEWLDLQLSQRNNSNDSNNNSNNSNNNSNDIDTIVFLTLDEFDRICSRGIPKSIVAKLRNLTR